MKILIVDDDEMSLELLEHAMERFGYVVEMASNGQDAVARIRRGDVRLVISDWEMPVVSGLEVCRAARSEDLPGYVYVILLTSHERPEDMAAGMEAGADDFIVKPFQPAQLAARLRAAERMLSLETRELAIFALAKLAESRDPDTGAHLERVRHYSAELGRELSRRPESGKAVGARECHLMFLTSPLHDIGKVAIPDSILLKPDRLTDREFEIMKSHTTIGAETLDAALAQHPTACFLRMARDIAAFHHERYDGTGYPMGLVGEAIPVAARVVALADVYDAVTSRRVYKSALTHEVARGIIVKECGTQFDPWLVEAFLGLEEKFLEIRARHVGPPTGVGMAASAA